MDIIQKSKKHIVKFLFGNKYKFFEVESAVTGKKHEVSIQWNCTCEYMSREGQANNGMCSHVLAIFNKLSKDGWNNKR